MLRHLARSAASVALLLVACAPMTQAPRTYGDGFESLRAVSSDYSLRLDEVGSRQTLSRDSAMREGLLAGDGRIFVTAALFHRGSRFGLDLIVLNRQGETIVLRRDDLFLVDSRGAWLKPLEDWKEARGHGLRGKANLRLQHEYYVSESDYFPSQAAPLVDVTTTPSSDPKSRQYVSAYSRDIRWSLDPGFSRVSAVTAPMVEAGTPDSLAVAAGANAAWWAYWEGDENVQYPLTVFVMLDHRHMVFQFDR